MGNYEYNVPWEKMNIMSLGPWEIKNIMSLGYYEMSRIKGNYEYIEGNYNKSPYTEEDYEKIVFMC